MSFCEFDWTHSDKHAQVLEKQTAELQEEHQSQMQEEHQSKMQEAHQSNMQEEYQSNMQEEQQVIGASGHEGILSISNEESFSNLGLWFLGKAIQTWFESKAQFLPHVLKSGPRGPLNFL